MQGAGYNDLLELCTLQKWQSKDIAGQGKSKRPSSLQSEHKLAALQQAGADLCQSAISTFS
jgi:hypothetical protein